jgi:oligoendopeptidase F
MKKRSEIDKKEIWAIEDLYENDQAFYNDLDKLKKLADNFIKNYKDLKTAEDLYNSLEDYSDIVHIAGDLSTFAGISKEVDATDQAPLKREAKLWNCLSKVLADLSFYSLEISKLDDEILAKLATDHPDYKYFLDRVKENAKYTLNDQTESVLAALEPTFNAPYQNYNDSRYGDMTFENFEYNGEEIKLNHNSFEEYLEIDPRKELRREAFKKYHEALRRYESTTASIYNTQITNEKRISDIRGYESVFHYLLAKQDVDFDIYENHIDTIMKELAPHMRKYANIIKKHHGLDEMTYADLKLSIDTDYEPEVTIEEARDYIVEGLSPLGKDYVDMLKKAFDENWIDYAQNIGKRTGAFCASPYGSHPFIMTSYNNKMSQVMTLAHELGHAGQGILSNSNQKALNSEMSMYFVEAPSTANEITMERFLLKKAKDKRERLWVLTTMIGKTYYHNFVTHFLEAAFQRDVYRRVERGESLTAADFNEIFRENLEKFWGDSVKLNDGAELTWMRQPHYYMGLYSFTYQAGLTVGTMISDKIVNGEDEDRKRWLEVLKLGGTRGPIELAKAAGVDMSNTQALSDTISFIGSIIDEIDELLEELDMYK